jgi:hypothetical protein
MQARTLTIVTILVDLKNAFLALLRENRKNPALLMMYAFIDICAALVNDGKTKNREIFEACIKTHVALSGKPFSAYELWAARSSLLHAYSPLGYHTEKERGARPIFYYAWPDRKEEMEVILRAKDYTDFILLNIEDVQWVAIDIINSILRHLDDDPAFEVRFLKNSEHFLFDLQAFKLEAEWSMLQELARRGRADA